MVVKTKMCQSISVCASKYNYHALTESRVLSICRDVVTAADNLGKILCKWTLCQNFNSLHETFTSHTFAFVWRADRPEANSRANLFENNYKLNLICENCIR